LALERQVNPSDCGGGWGWKHDTISKGIRTTRDPKQLRRVEVGYPKQK